MRYQGAAYLNKPLYHRKQDILKTFGFHGCLCFDEYGEAAGYILYKKSNSERRITIREVVYRDIDALQALWGLVYRHNAECEQVTAIVPASDPTVDLLGEYKGEMLHRPDMMLRAIDVKGALQKRHYAEDIRSQLNIEICDGQAPWNHGIWQLSLKDGHGRAEKVKSSADVHMDIKAFTQMVIGFRDAKQLHRVHKIKTASQPMINRLCEIFPKSDTYLTERF